MSMKSFIIGEIVGVAMVELVVKPIKKKIKESKNKRSFVTIDGKYYEADILAAEEA